MAKVMRDPKPRHVVKSGPQLGIERKVLTLPVALALHAQNYQREVTRSDSSVSKAIVGGQAGACPVRSLALDARQPFLLYRDDNLTAMKQTRSSVVRG